MMTHRKHANIKKRSQGFFGPNEIAILGAKCALIQDLAKGIAEKMKDHSKVAFIDASHAQSLDKPPMDQFTFHHSGHLASRKNYDQNPYQDKLLFSSYDLLLINGNHYQGQRQILILDREKEASLKKRLDQITDVLLLIKTDKNLDVFDFLLEKFPHLTDAPTCYIDEVDKIADQVIESAQQQVAKIQGLILAGGQSQRMGTDKGLLRYFGKPQRLYAFELLEKYHLNTYLSVRKEQEVEQVQCIRDVFEGLGPFGAICSAFQHDPDSAWLVLATDLPYVDEGLVLKLLENRDPSKLATAIKGKRKDFPEPLITIWEPRAYPVMLQFLAMGYSCPRKVLINSEVKIVETDDAYLYNVNTPEEYEKARSEIKKQ